MMIQEVNQPSRKLKSVFNVPKRLRSAIRALTELGNIEVVIDANNRCETDGKTVYLPSLSPQVSVKEFNSFVGHAQHEAGHIIFSKFDPVERQKEFNKLVSTYSSGFTDKLVFYVYNYVEDVRMETCLMEKIPGTDFYQTEGAELILDMQLTSQSSSVGSTKALSANGEIHEAFLFAMMFIYSTHTPEGLEKLASHKAHIIMAKNPYFTDFYNRISPVFRKVKKNCSNVNYGWIATKEILIRVAELIKKLEDEKNKSGQRQKNSNNAAQQALNTIAQGGTPQSGQSQPGQGQPGQSGQPQQQGQQQGGGLPGKSGNVSHGDTPQQDDPSNVNPQTVQQGLTSLQSYMNRLDTGNTNHGTQSYRDQRQKLKDISIDNNTTSNIQTEENYGIRGDGSWITPVKDKITDEFIEKSLQESRKFKKAFIGQFISFRRKLRKRFQTEGVLDTTNIHKVLTEKSRTVFKQEKKFKRVNTSLMLSLDVSGSMSSLVIPVRKIAIAIDDAIKGTNVDFTVSIFDSHFQIIKKEREKLSKDSIEHICAHGGTSLEKATITSAKYLMTRRSERKIFIAITDGCVNEKTATADSIAMRNGVECYYVLISQSMDHSEAMRNSSPIPKERTVACSGDFCNTFLKKLQTLLEKGYLND